MYIVDRSFLSRENVQVVCLLTTPSHPIASGLVAILRLPNGCQNAKNRPARVQNLLIQNWKVVGVISFTSFSPCSQGEGVLHNVDDSKYDWVTWDCVDSQGE